MPFLHLGPLVAGMRDRERRQEAVGHRGVPTHKEEKRKRQIIIRTKMKQSRISKMIKNLKSIDCITNGLNCNSKILLN